MEVIEQVLITEDQIKSKIEELGARISEEYKGQELTIVGILHGSFLFAADLCRAIKGVEVMIDFMSVTSYGDESASSGMVKIIMDTKKPITGKNILVVEDIIDSGLTMKYLLELLRARNPKTLETAVLLVKPGAKYPIVPKYYGWEVRRDQFIVGYGLDYAGKYRCFNFVGVLKEEVYKK